MSAGASIFLALTIVAVFAGLLVFVLYCLNITFEAYLDAKYPSVAQYDYRIGWRKTLYDVGRIRADNKLRIAAEREEETRRRTSGRQR